MEKQLEADRIVSFLSWEDYLRFSAAISGPVSLEAFAWWSPKLFEQYREWYAKNA